MALHGLVLIDCNECKDVREECIGTAVGDPAMLDNHPSSLEAEGNFWGNIGLLHFRNGREGKGSINDRR